MLEKIAWGEVWAIAKKALPFVLLAAVAVYIAILRHDLSKAHDQLDLESQFRHSLQVTLSAPKEDHATLLNFAAAVVKEDANRKTTLDQISREALQAEQHSRAADAALAQEQQANARKFASAQRQITELQNRKPTGNPTADCKAIEEDSKAAWKGWQ